MIETIYKRKNIIIEIKMSPFFPFIEMLSTKYLENGYHPHIIRGNFSLILLFIRWAAHKRCTPEKMRSSHVQAFFKSPTYQSRASKRNGTQACLERLWGMLERKYKQTLIKRKLPHYQRNPEVNKLIEEFKAYMHEVKGLAPTSITRFKTTVGQFLTYLFPQGKVHLRKIQGIESLFFHLLKKHHNRHQKCLFPAFSFSKAPRGLRAHHLRSHH